MRRQGGLGVGRLALALLAVAFGLGGSLVTTHRPVAAVVVSPHAGAVAPGAPGPRPQRVAVPQSATKLLGQRIMVGFSGASPSPELLASIRRGEVGSVILFAPNIVSERQTLRLTGELQHAARSGGNPGLLIAVDQEGGQVKRLPNGPPDLSPPQIAATHSARVATREGRATGSYLRRYGINMDLAPVSDVPTYTGAFIWRQGRAFSFHAATVATDAAAFALGLQSQGVAATAKHFPGLGSAAIDTDFKRQELHPSEAQRIAALTPYRMMIPLGLDAVMLSTAGFPAYDPTGSSAALSRPMIAGVLRGQLGFGGVTITDALGTPTGHDERTAGRLAAAAGADILLFTDSAPGELGALRAALRSGQIGQAGAAAAYRRIFALKHKLGLA